MRAVKTPSTPVVSKRKALANASAMMAEMGDLLKSFVPSKPASKEDEAQGKVLLDAALLTQ